MANRRNITSEDIKQEVLAKIKQYKDKGFAEAGRIHEIIMEANPNLVPRLWYGMPGYAMSKDSAVLCFFRKDTLVTFGITEAAKLDSLVQDDSYAASSWFITNLNQSSEDLISRTVKSISE